MAVRLDGGGEVSGDNTVKREFVPGSNNAAFIDEAASAGTGRVGGTPVYNNVNNVIVAEMKAAAKKMGENPAFYEQIFETYNADFWKDADRDIFRYGALLSDTPSEIFDANVSRGSGVYGSTNRSAADEFLTNPESFEKLISYARWWYSNKIPGLADNWGGTSDSSGSHGSGSGITSADIKKSFDVAQLATRVDDLYHAYLIDKSDDPRGVANAYINAVVKNPDQKLDFDTFVIGNYIQKSPRYASIYVNKPEGMSETDYLGAYTSRARSVLRPEEAEAVAIGGAQFGADASAFEERLKRSNEYRTSSPFIESFQGRLSSLRGVLKG